MKPILLHVAPLIFAASLYAQSSFVWSPSAGGNGHFYEFISAPTASWTDARDGAAARGGYLATITSQAENDAIWAHWNYRYYWIGGFQPTGSPEPTGGWRWVTNEPFQFQNWASGQPDNYQGSENFLEFDGAVGRWNDIGPVRISFEFGYVVEYGAPPRVLPTTPVSRPQAFIAQPRSAGATSLTLVTHGWRDSATASDGWVETLASNIDDQANSSWDVRTYDWGQYSGSGLSIRDAYLSGNTPDHARANAVILGKQIGEQILALGYSSVHFVAHSAGSWLIDSAADALAGSGITVHTTFLDSYVPLGTSHKLGDTSTWAEQYYHSSFNTPLTQATLEQAVNFDITGLAPTGVDDHSWPYIWYSQTADDPTGSIADGWGFQRSLELGNLPSHANYARGTTNVLGQPNGGPSETTPTTLSPSTNFALSDNVISNTGTVAINGTELTLATGSPVWINSLVESDKHFNLLTFSYDFLSDAEGLLSIYLDGNLLFLIDEQSQPDGILTESLWLGLDYTPGTHYLSFRLDPQSDEQSQVAISNVAVGNVVPEPSTAFLILVSLCLLLTQRHLTMRCSELLRASR